MPFDRGHEWIPAFLVIRWRSATAAAIYAARGVVDGSVAVERVRDGREMALRRPMPIAHEGYAQKT
ncbi:hypothetical protein [Burkholderia sp. Ac-20365]|uniref:hypothetical protein n=1 Tax=Burkholderia sp. Ac-20365 TaxID=2703897 RepID=UPI00197BC113|nr:hypothetical protein [Burkholderia sp. Ac-20365]MBN3759699.1 hypothetical protein [Burkholderia sp. Ac-20365]